MRKDTYDLILAKNALCPLSHISAAKNTVLIDAVWIHKPFCQIS